MTASTDPTTALTYLVIPQADLTHLDSGAYRGPTVTVRFITSPDEIIVLRRHWSRGWQPCEGKHCPWCLRGDRIIQSYDAEVESDGERYKLQMNLTLYRQIRGYADHLKADFNSTPLRIRRKGHGIYTQYEVFQ